MKSEQASEVALFTACSTLYVDHPAVLVFPLETDIHHEILVAHVSSIKLACLAFAFIDGNILHGIGSEIVEHQLVVLAEEVAAVQK